MILAALAGHSHLCIPPVPFTTAPPFVTACGISAARSPQTSFWVQKDPKRPAGAEFAERRGIVCDVCKQKEAEIRDR
jgi:hypothetical protein